MCLEHITDDISAHRSKTLEGSESLFLGGGGLFEGLVLLDQVFHFVDGVLKMDEINGFPLPLLRLLTPSSPDFGDGS